MSNPQIRRDRRGVLGGHGARNVGGARGALGDRGQAAIEFTGMVPIILATAVLLWQAALVGYTFSLAGNAADEAVRAGTVADSVTRTQACREAGEKDLPDAWDSTIVCRTDGDLVKAEVDLEIPFLFPGSLNLGFTTVPGRSAAVRES
ncbi:TadE family protein [Streptomyces sp. NBC_01508]|uniref:TadE family protein n=1 Tax=Streptomyces sp. NBC_01508 TaxID=2903888 RepID=UPI0038650814